MITASKMSAHSVAYYESTVDRSAKVGTDLSDYYSERGDTAPRVVVAGRSGEAGRDFLGEMTSALGVSQGEILSAEQVESWFSQQPTAPSGEVLGVKVRADGLHGWDLTVGAPKSVSLLWALGSEAEQVAAQEAHEAGVRAALDYLGEHASYTRARVPGVEGVGVVRSAGLAGVAYQHRTSRAADPHLHTHLLISNKTMSADGRWLTLDGQSLMHELRAAGTIYQATLRAHLTESLGVAWQPVDTTRGLSELANVRREDIEAWSQRHTQMSAWMDEKGIKNAGAAAQQEAQKATRERKELGASTAELRAMWGADQRNHRGVLAGIRAPHRDGEGRVVAVRDRVPEVAEVLAELAERRSTWTRADAAEVVASMMPASVPAAEMGERVEALTGAVVGEAVDLEAPARTVEVRSGLVPVDGRRPLSDREGTRRFTTEGTIQREAHALRQAGEAAGLGVSVAPVLHVAMESDMSVAQFRAMCDLVSSDQRVSVLVAPAGAGKTHSLHAARAAWEDAGHEVVGLAPTGAAADQMVRDEAVSGAETIATALGTARRQGRVWAPGTVVLVDEAGMAGSADLAELIGQAAQDRARLVLIGDPDQLQAPTVAAGLLGHLADALPDTVELSEVWRQRDEAERAVTLALRQGTEAETAQAVAWYAEHERLSIGGAADMADAVLAAWTRDQVEGVSSLVMAPTWEMAESISAAAQAWRIERGQVDATGGAVQLGDVRHPGAGEVAHVGDWITTRANDYQLRTSSGEPVRTSQRWRVEAITAGGGAVVSRLDAEGETVTLPARYLAQHARLAYSVTVHGAQGQTVDRAHVLMDAARTDRASAYVGMTRGRELNAAYIVDEARAAAEAAAARGGRAPVNRDAAHAGPSPVGADRWAGTSQEAAEALGGIVARDRRDLAAHTVLRQRVAEEASRQAGLYGREVAGEHERIGSASTRAGQVLSADQATRANLRERIKARAAQMRTERAPARPAVVVPEPPVMSEHAAALRARILAGVGIVSPRQVEDIARLDAVLALGSMDTTAALEQARAEVAPQVEAENERLREAWVEQQMQRARDNAAARQDAAQRQWEGLPFWRRWGTEPEVWPAPREEHPGHIHVSSYSRAPRISDAEVTARIEDRAAAIQADTDTRTVAGWQARLRASASLPTREEEDRWRDQPSHDPDGPDFDGYTYDEYEYEPPSHDYGAERGGPSLSR